MDPKVKEFVEKFNENLRWNKYILDKIKDVFSPVITKDLIKDYLPVKEVTEEWIDLEHAKVFTIDNGGLEMQAFNNDTLGTTYFWVFPDETEMEYKKKKINSIKKYVTGRKEELENKIEELYAENKELSFIESVCDKTSNFIKQ